MVMVLDPTAKREYLDLVDRFPLTAIQDDAHLDAAMAVLDGLVNRLADLSAAERVYLDALSTLVEAYEEEHHAIPPVNGVEVLEFLAEENGLTQSELADIMGTTQSVVSEILSGKRRLALPHIERLSSHFGVSADTFLAGSPR